ncbi:MAG: hypothetical protein ACK5AZ_11980 [Bryobacteraceae bacterium]
MFLLMTDTVLTASAAGKLPEIVGSAALGAVIVTLALVRRWRIEKRRRAILVRLTSPQSLAGTRPF